MSQVFSKIWIVVIIATILGGGILAWRYFGALKEEVKREEVKIPEEKVPEKEKI